ncbi:MAG: C40 family peptidase, partial [Nocardioidaceae bacterium]
LTNGPSASVLTRVAVLTTDRGTMSVSLATVLWVESASPSEVTVHLPGGRSGRLAGADVALAHKQEPATFTPQDVLGSARGFLGLRYLWGGTSGWGVDCSGLVHLAFRARRLLVPRDAADQAGWSELARVPLDEVRPGDLYFFARPGHPVHHVGFATSAVGNDGARAMLHAPEGRAVEERPMSPERQAMLVSAGRISRPPPDGSPTGWRR